MRQLTISIGTGTAAKPGKLPATGVILGLLLLAGAARAADSTAYQEGQKIEVREGDTWSAATVLKHEGRKYQIHYDGSDASSDEWVTTNRMRLPGAATPSPSSPAAGASSPASGATQRSDSASPAAKTAPPHKSVNWPLHTNVEVKWGGIWRKAGIVNRRGEWYLINYDNGPFEEWVEPWRIRKLGSTDDPIGNAPIHPTVRKGNPGNPPAGNPGVAPEPFGHETGSTKALESQQTPLTATDRAASREVALGGGGVDSFKLDPDALPTPAKPLSAAPLALQAATGEFFDHVKALYFSAPASATAAVVFSNEPPGKVADVRVERIDLVAGKSLGAGQLPLSVEPLDLSPDGKLLLSRSNGFGFGAAGRLDVWQVDGPQAAHLISFVPFDNQQPTARDVKWARFTDPEHVAVLGGNGQVAVFEYRKAREIWSAHADAAAAPALSANGKYVAVAIKGPQIAILETASGATAGRLSIESVWQMRLSFRPDGAQLAAVGPELLDVWDLGTGKRAYDLMPIEVRGDQIAWQKDGFILLDGKSLFALDRKMTVWTYEGPNGGQPPMGATYAGRYWYVAAEGGKAALVSVVLPHEPAFRATVAAKIDRDMIVKPGSSISLDAQLNGDVQEKAIAGLKATLAADGITVADNAPVKLVARSEPGKTREITYRHIGGGPWVAPSKVSVTDMKNQIRLETADGKVIWQHVGMTMAPPMLMMKKGQTVEQAVAEATKPSALFFTKARIPKYVPKSKTGFGTSRLTPAGLQNASVPL